LLKEKGSKITVFANETEKDKKSLKYILNKKKAVTY